MDCVTDPRDLWADLTEWHGVGMHETVSRVRLPGGTLAYVRPDDGSAQLLHRLRAGGTVPVPEVLDIRAGWLLLSALPGIPLHDPRWLLRPLRAAAIAADALRRLEKADVQHGDMCVPNILGDVESGRLTGIVDWRYAGQSGREIDVASTVWSCGFNGYPATVAIAVLQECGWPRSDAVEVARLSAVWVAHAGGT